MKMVDGSTVRHGRVDCSYHESASECGGQSHNHTGAVGKENKEREKRQGRVMRREEERRKRRMAVVRIRH